MAAANLASAPLAALSLIVLAVLLVIQPPQVNPTAIVAATQAAHAQKTVVLEAL
jgi:hypothetical protein